MTIHKYEKVLIYKLGEGIVLIMNTGVLAEFHIDTVDRHYLRKRKL